MKTAGWAILAVTYLAALVIIVAELRRWRSRSAGYSSDEAEAILKAYSDLAVYYDDAAPITVISIDPAKGAIVYLRSNYEDTPKSRYLCTGRLVEVRGRYQLSLLGERRILEDV